MDAERVLAVLKRVEWEGVAHSCLECGYGEYIGRHSPICELGALIAEYEHEAATTGWQSTVGMFTGDTAMMEVSEATRKVREDHRVDGSGGWRPGSEPPQDMRDVIVCAGGGDLFRIGYYSIDEKKYAVSHDYKMTHVSPNDVRWHDLPPLPPTGEEPKP